MTRTAPVQLLLPDGSMRIMIDTLEREGLDPNPAICAAGFDPKSWSLQRQISPEQERAFQRAFIATTGYRPDLWLRMGMDYSLATFGQFALVMMTAASLRAMLTNPDLSRFGFFGLGVRPVAIDNRVMGVAFDARDTPPDLRELAVLVSLGCVLRLYPELVGRDFAFSLLCLPFDDPDGRLAGIAGVPLSLNAERAMAFWPDSASERPFRNANPVLYRAYTAAVQSLLGPERGDETFRSRVSTSICRHILRPDMLDGVAEELGLTPRTLQRRLAQSGLTFRSLVDDCRRESAIRELAFHDRPLAEIAWGLGYSDFTGFAHAFQRWTGTSPGQFRRHARGYGDDSATAVPSLQVARTGRYS